MSNGNDEELKPLIPVAAALIAGIIVGATGMYQLRPEPEQPEAAVRAKKVLDHVYDVRQSAMERTDRLKDPDDPMTHRLSGMISACGLILGRYSNRNEDIRAIGAEIGPYGPGPEPQ